MDFISKIGLLIDRKYSIGPILRQGIIVIIRSWNDDLGEENIVKKVSAVIIGLLMLWLSCQGAYAQTGNDVLAQLPSNLELREDGPQKYSFVCDYFYLDPQGNLTGKDRISAVYTRALPDGKMRWNDVRIAQAKEFEAPFPAGELQQYMEGFTYRISSGPEILRNEFFPGFPAGEMRTKNLIWDTFMFEMFGWDYLDKLQLNQVYSPQSGPEDVPLAGAGTFQNHRIELTWIGISEMNGERCALIRYQAFFNKLAITTEQMSMKGRSHYWGEIWVSLQDKQIEQATLDEDVLMELTLSGQAEKMIVNVFRKAAFVKLEPTE